MRRTTAAWAAASVPAVDSGCRPSAQYAEKGFGQSFNPAFIPPTKDDFRLDHVPPFQRLSPGISTTGCFGEDLHETTIIASSAGIRLRRRHRDPLLNDTRFTAALH